MRRNGTITTVKVSFCCCSVDVCQLGNYLLKDVQEKKVKSDIFVFCERVV